MDPRFIDELRRQAYTLSEETVPFLERQLTAGDRKSVKGLQRTAAQTRLTALLMDAVSWLFLLDPQRPAQRSMRLTIRVAPNEETQQGDVEPALADLIARVVNFHRRLEHIEVRLDNASSADPNEGLAVPAFVSAPCDATTNA